MSVFRLHKNGNYTSMSTFHLRDTRLTWQAKGMLSFMYSNAETFEYSIEGLVKCACNGETSVKSILKELKQHGYLEVYAIRNSKGQVVDWQYDIYERPEDGKPDAEKPDVENPHVENQGQSNINKSNDSINSTPYSRTNIESKPKEEKPIKERKCKEKAVLDYSFIEEEWKDAFRQWVMYKQERGEMYKTQRTLEAAYENLKEYSLNDPANAMKCVRQSIGNNYQGLFPLKQTNNGQHSSVNTTASPASYYAAVGRACDEKLKRWGIEMPKHI